MKRKVVVIGAGIAGLAVSIELLQKGFDVTLIEKNKDVGGLCSGYDVDGYYIDGCLHWLLGFSKGNKIYKLWKNIGAYSDEVPVISLPYFSVIEYNGVKVRFGRDLEKTKEEWLSLFKEDEEEINKFFSLVKAMKNAMAIAISDKNNKSPFAIPSIILISPKIVKIMSVSREEYSHRFKNEALRFAFKNAMTGYNNLFFFVDVYALFSMGNADIPSGGAKYMMERIKNRFLSLGGELNLNEEVKEIKITKEVVSKVITNKAVYESSYVVSAIDPQYMLNNLIKDECHIKRLEKARNNIDKNPISSCFNVYITVEGDISYIDVPTGIKISPIKIGHKETDFMLIRPYHFEPKYFTKDGKTVVSLFVDQNHKDYEFFKSLCEEDYQKEKDRIIKNMIDAFTTRYVEFKGKIHLLSFFGPLELEKRSNTSFGALQSYSFTKKSNLYMTSGRIKGIKNLYYCGQWSRSLGGTPTAIMTAHAISKKIK